VAVNFHIVNETKATLRKSDRVVFRSIKEAALGPDYNLTLIFTSPAKIKKLNTIYRDKEEATDILSFPVSSEEGEIYICLSEVRRQAKDFDRTYENFLVFLFIHGCVHLKGYDHGGTMERIEAKIRKQFEI